MFLFCAAFARVRASFVALSGIESTDTPDWLAGCKLPQAGTSKSGDPLHQRTATDENSRQSLLTLSNSLR